MTNKVALITGGSRGIGKAVAMDLARQGYDLALIARDEVRLNNVKDEINTLYDVNISTFTLDVQNLDEVKQAIDNTLNAHKKIDVVFNNAGILKNGTDNISPDDFDALLNINLKGMYNILHTIVPQLKTQKSGYIFNLASMAGKVGVPGLGAYALTKFGVVGFNDSLYYELLPYNIKVTALCPSSIATDMTRNFTISKEQMISTDDIVKAVNFALSLSDNACVPELLRKCKTYDLG